MNRWLDAALALVALAAAGCGGSGNGSAELRTMLKRANAKRAKLGLPPIAHVTNHTLRRTFASLMYDAVAQPTAVMAQMGHKSSKLALEVYAKRMNCERDTGKRDGRPRQWALNGHKRRADVPNVRSQENGKPCLAGLSRWAVQDSKLPANPTPTPVRDRTGDRTIRSAPCASVRVRGATRCGRAAVGSRAHPRPT
jgi:hypothetical protein